MLTSPRESGNQGETIVTNEAIQTMIHPLGMAKELALVHAGKSFRVFQARLNGQDVCLKSPALWPDLNSVGLSTYSKRTAADVLVSGSTGTFFEGEDFDFDLVVQTLSQMLMIERQVIDATSGAWNHSVQGLCIWDDGELPDSFEAADDIPPSGNPRPVPVLVMPRHQATPLAALETNEKRELLPRMLPAFWKVLSHTYHGNLSEENVLVTKDRTGFHLIDPGVSFGCGSTGAGPRPGENAWRQVAFLTTPANYPILPPFNDEWARPDNLIKSLERFIAGQKNHRKLMAPGAYRWRGGNDQPAASDLLALGVIYARVLTGEDPFLGPGRLLDVPAWMGNLPSFSNDRMMDPGEVGPAMDRVHDALAAGWVDTFLDREGILPNERRLAQALLLLEPISSADLISVLRV